MSVWTPVTIGVQVDLRLLAMEQRVLRAEGWVAPDEGAALQAAVDARERQVAVARAHHDMLHAQFRDVQGAVGTPWCLFCDCSMWRGGKGMQVVYLYTCVCTRASSAAAQTRSHAAAVEQACQAEAAVAALQLDVQSLQRAVEVCACCLLM